MGNGASTGQGGNPTHGTRDVREAADTEQHDWSQLAEAPITNTLLATANSYNSRTLFVRRRFFPGRRQTCRWVGSSTNLPFSRCHIFIRFRNNIGINCTLRQHTVLDFCYCWHRQGWRGMTLNARFNLKCALRTARLTYTYVLASGAGHAWVSEWVRIFKRRTKTESHYAPQCHLNKNAWLDEHGP